MSAITCIFPHQLFEAHPALVNKPIYLIEEALFFNQFSFHKQKLVFHRASMTSYKEYLERKSYEVTYINAIEPSSDVRVLFHSLSERGVTEVHYVDVVDCWLQQRMESTAQKFNITLVRYESPQFLLTSEAVDEYFHARKRLFQTDFYIQQRKKFKILVDSSLQPVGGKWSYDSENRLKFPKGKVPPSVFFPEPDSHWQEASTYVQQNFGTNYGVINHDFIYPTNFSESRSWLTQFLHYRFAEFGDFEDAVVAKESVLHHSLLTPLLNVGLLTPEEVLKEAVVVASNLAIPMNSVEGFIRQILGWREFIRGVYVTKGTQERTTNFWKFSRKIPPSFWNGTTGIVPIDITIRKVLDTGYCHHIERLMVLGNFMLLCEFDPDEVYKWFMELFIDAYDWVMVPNVYGMSQFADGGLMATKPYISGSNYLMKMSDYPKGDWQVIWDALFWNFMDKQREFFLKNPRLGMLIKTFDKMPEAKRLAHRNTAAKFLQSLN